MEFKKILHNSVNYPSYSWTKVIMLGLLLIGSILIVPMFLIIGYLFRVMKSSLSGIDELPNYNKFGSMLIDGFKVFLVGIIYTIPIIIVTYLLNGIFKFLNNNQNFVYNTGNFTGSNIIFSYPIAMLKAYINYYHILFISNPILAVINVIVNILILIFAILISLIAYAAVVNMAFNNGNLTAAFKIRKLIEMISKIGWKRYIIWYVVILIIGVIIGLISLSIISIYIGLIVIPFIITPYFIISAARSLSLLFISK